MSTLLYAAITRKREEATPGRSTKDQPPGVNTYVDALAALVPAEVLAVHTFVIGRATKTTGGQTTITAPDQLAFWFWFLAIAAVVVYVIGLRKIPMGWDLVRMFIPAFAFLGWTMLQPTTVFDALASSFDPDWRWTIGLALAVVLGALAGVLGGKADAKPTPAAH